MGEEGGTQYSAVVFCGGSEECLEGPCIFDAGVPPLTLELVMYFSKTPRYLCQLEPELTYLLTCTGHIKNAVSTKGVHSSRIQHLYKLKYLLL